MLMAEKFDVSTLNWVKGEIDETLKQARVSLENYVDNTADDAQIRFCVAYLHQVRGTLQMVELFGAAQVAQEMESLATAIQEQKLEQPQGAYELLMRSVLLLPDYLETLQAGQPDSPIVLLPLVNELRAAYNQQPLAEGALFKPDFSTTPPPRAADAPVVNMRALAHKLYPYYHNSLVKISKNTDLANSVKTIATVVEKLLIPSSRHEIRQWLWVASAYVEGLRTRAIRFDNAAKQLLLKNDQLIKAIVALDQTGMKVEHLHGVTRALLFQIGKGEAKGNRLIAVRRAFKLESLLPDEETLQRTRETMSGFNSGLKKTVSADVMEELSRVKDALDLFVRSDLSTMSHLSTIATSLESMSHTLSLLRQDALRNTIMQQSEVVKRLISGQNTPDDQVLMGVAAAVLAVESALKDWGGVMPVEQADDLEDQVSDAEREPQVEAEHRRVIRQVMKEAKDDLVKLREGLNTYLENPEGSASTLEQMPLRLHQIVGSLSLLSYRRVAQVVRACGFFIIRELPKASERTPEKLDALADALMSVEYYLEAFVESRVHPASVLEVAERAVNSLGYSIDSLPTDDLIQTDKTEDSDEGGDDLILAAEQGAAISDDAATILTANTSVDRAHTQVEEVPEAPAVMEGATATEVVSTTEPEVSEVDHVVVDEGAFETHSDEVATKPEPESDDAEDELDEEIIEIFIEEAEEVLENIGECLPRWKANPGDEESLGDLRRAFHTLKGSGRLVGAKILGEFAWAFEDMLNRVIDKTVPVSNAMFDLMEQTYEALPELVTQFKDGTAPTVDYEFLQEAAEDFSKPGGLAVATANTKKKSESVVASGSDAAADKTGRKRESEPVEAPALIDPVLLEIYTNEVESHLGVLDEFVQVCRDEGRCRVEEPIVRALHTLQGSSRMADVKAVAELSAGLEKYAKDMQVTRRPLESDAVDITALYIEFCKSELTYLQDPEQGSAPDKQALQRRVDALNSGGDTSPDVNPEAGLATKPEMTTSDLSADESAVAGVGVALGSSAVVSEISDTFTEANFSEPTDYGAEEELLQSPVLDETIEAVADTIAESVSVADEAIDEFGSELNLQTDSEAEADADADADVLDLADAEESVLESESSEKDSAPLDLDELFEGAGLGSGDQVSSVSDDFGDGGENLAVNLPDASLDEYDSPTAEVADTEEVVLESESPEEESAPLDLEELFEGAGFGSDVPVDSTSWERDEGEEASAVNLLDESLEEYDITTAESAEAEVNESIQYDELHKSGMEPAQHSEVVASTEIELAVEEAPPTDSVSDKTSQDESQSDYTDSEIEAIVAAPVGDESDISDEIDIDSLLDFSSDEIVVTQSEADFATDHVADQAVAEEPSIEDDLGEITEDLNEIEGDLAAISKEQGIVSDFETLLDEGELSSSLQEEPAQEVQAEQQVTPLAGIDIYDSPDFDEDVVDIFLEEGVEILDASEGTLQEWIDNPDDRSLITSLQRQLHTIKGGARMAGISPVGDLCHSFETVLEAVADGIIERSREMTELLQLTHDRLVIMLEQVQNREPLSGGDDLIVRVDALARRAEGGGAEVSDVIPGGDAGITDSAVAVVADSDDLLEAFPEATEDDDSLVAFDADESLSPQFSDDTSADEIPVALPITPAEPELETFVLEDVDQDVLEIFLEEGQEILDASESTLQSWVENPDDRELVGLLLRQLHTLKGGARMAGITPVGDLSHSLETVLGAVVDGLLDRSREMFSILQLTHDRLVQMLDQVKNQEPIVTGGDLIAQVNALAERTVGVEEVVLQDEESNGAEFTPQTSEGTEKRTFVDLATDWLHTLQRDVKRWQREHDNLALVDEMSTSIDSLIDDSTTEGIIEISELGQAMRKLLRNVVDGHVPVSEEMFRLIQLSDGRLEEMLRHLRINAPIPNGRYLITSIDEFINVSRQSNEPDIDNSASVAAAADVDVPLPLAAAPAARPAEAESKGGDNRRRSGRVQQEMVRVGADMLDHLVGFAGEVSIYRSRVEQQFGTLRFNLGEFDQTIERLRGQIRQFDIETEAQIQSRREEIHVHAGEGEADFDPLEFDRFTTMQQLSRSMMESLSDLTSIESMISEIARESETLLLQQSRVNTDLQEGLMHTRMMPLVENAPRLRRLVRQVSTELGKQVEMRFQGAEVEMDRNAVNRIMAPLEHLLRNAIGHGLESPEARRAAGKSEAGTIVIAQSRERSEIVIRISDDGIGIDLDKVRKKATDRGLMRADADLSDKEVMHFILESGFSTADSLTQVSGRGVGMDVVSSEIKQLGGALDIDSVQGQGTTFTIRLPLMMSVSRSLLVTIGEDTYAIPLLSIVGIERIPKLRLQELLESEKATYNWLGRDFSLLNLRTILGVHHEHVVAEDDKYPLLLTQTGDHLVALAVDGLIGSREVVIKSLGPQLSKVNGLSGATVLADGRVSLILDLPSLVRTGLAQRGKLADEMAAQLAAPVKRKRDGAATVMVVDDSITVRKVSERMLKRNRFNSVTAKDGVEALAVLEEVMPDVMLLDIEMPRMDGYELATHIRNSDRLKHIPIIMITSRTGDKHRQRAMDIGVNVYLGKPFQESDLLEQIRMLLKEDE